MSFPSDPSAQGGQAMQLEAATDGTSAGTAQAQVSTVERKFYGGTYAARVYFNDAPSKGTALSGDHPVESFYSISPVNPNSTANPSLYSELDNEYLPGGGWSDPGPALHTTSWLTDTAERTYYAVNSLQG